VTNTDIDESEKQTGTPRDRSPSFPSLPLEKAVERARQLFEKAKRHEVRLQDAAVDWGISPKSSAAAQIASTLLAFGLVDSVTVGGERKIKVSEEGWRILEDHRPGVKAELMKEAATKPKLFAEYAEKWKDGRPDNSHAISQLKFDSYFSDDAALKFLRVFDETIPFAKPLTSDKKSDIDQNSSQKADVAVAEKPDGAEGVVDAVKPLPTPPLGKQTGKQKGILMEGERELTTGLLSKGASFRLIVAGKVGEKEIERLIKKLELDKEILADPDPEPDEPDEEAAN
jgi:hypothetical protein